MAFEFGISRRTVLGMLGGIATYAATKSLPLNAEQSKRPNVVLLLSDDVGYGDLACLGNPVIKTPNLDGLYKRGIRFTDFHVSPSCAPSRASLMTGRYSDATGVWHTIMGRSLLDPEDVTMAECFRASGYKTGIYGKWHLGDNYPCRPQDLGFEDAVVCGGGGIWQTPDYFGNDHTDDTYIHNGQFQKYTGFSTDVFFDLAMGFMTDAQKEQKPFFCYLPTPAAHGPCWAKPADAAPYEGVSGLKAPGFYGMIANIDENLGRLQRFLEDKGLSDNTIILYAGDNGSQDGTHVYNASMRGQKGSPYEGGHRVPLFIYWPAGGLTGGKDIDVLTAHIDILPTLAELCQLRSRGKEVDGRSLHSLLYGNSAQWEERTVVVVDSQREEHLAKWRDTAVMTQRWRLVNPTEDGDPSTLELYNIEKDPGQENNVIAEHPEVTQSLKASYESWWKKASTNAKKYVRITVGNNKENPARLNCVDWHGDGANLVWNQRQIRTGPIANGFWAIDVNHAGRYRFELRRWPREVDLPITAAYIDPKPNREKTPGAAISATLANIMIGDVNQSKAIPPRAKYVEFTFDLPAGPAELRTAFYDSFLNERGAYYVYVERI